MTKQFRITSFILILVFIVTLFVDRLIIDEQLDKELGEDFRRRLSELWLNESRLVFSYLKKSTKGLKFDDVFGETEETLRRRSETMFRIEQYPSVDSVFFIDGNGILKYGTNASSEKKSKNLLVKNSIASATSKEGIAKDDQGKLSLQYAKFLSGKHSNESGVVVATTSLQEIIKRISRSFGAAIGKPLGLIVYDGDNTISAGSLPSSKFIEEINNLSIPGSSSGIRKIQDGKYSITNIQLKNVYGISKILHITFIVDVTTSKIERNLVSWLIGASIFLASFFLFFWLYQKGAKPMEKKLKKAEEQLANLSIVNSHLRQSNNLKEKLWASLSAELRNPLNGVCGTVDLLDEKDFKNDQEDYLSILKESVCNLTAVADDIRDFAKLEAGKFILRKAIFAPKKLFSSLREELEVFAEESGIIFSLEINENLPSYVEGDSRQVLRIAESLFKHAINTTEKGGEVEGQVYVDDEINGSAVIHIAVRSLRHKGKDQIKLSGDPKGLISHMGKKTLKIIISNEIASLMNGKIWLHTEEARQEKEVHATLRLKTLEATREIQKEEPLLSSDIPKDLFILLVEDLRINQKVVSHIVRKLGYKIEVATNGREALAMMEAKDFDLILMDIHMPEMDGLEATKEIRKIGDNKKYIPIIALTGKVLSVDQEVCIEAGMDDYLSKPLTRESLKLKISALKKRGLFNA